MTKQEQIKKALKQNIKSGIGYEYEDKFCDVSNADILSLIIEQEKEIMLLKSLFDIAISSCTNFETLYKIKCNQVEQTRKETAKEILDYFDRYAGNGELIGNIINRLRRKYSVEEE